MSTPSDAKRTKHAKGSNYRALIERIDVVLSHGCYFEAAWIAYAIIEDRMQSAVSNLGIKKESTLNRRIIAIQEARASNHLVNAVFVDKLLENIDAWRNARNRLMHDLAEEEQPHTDIVELANEGRVLARQLCNAVTGLKRRLNK